MFTFVLRVYVCMCVPVRAFAHSRVNAYVCKCAHACVQASPTAPVRMRAPSQVYGYVEVPWGCYAVYALIIFIIVLGDGREKQSCIHVCVLACWFVSKHVCIDSARPVFFQLSRKSCLFQSQKKDIYYIFGGLSLNSREPRSIGEKDTFGEIREVQQRMFTWMHVRVERTYMNAPMGTCMHARAHASRYACRMRTLISILLPRINANIPACKLECCMLVRRHVCLYR